MGRDDRLPVPLTVELSAALRIAFERKAGGGAVMASSFLIVMSIWFGINILFLAVRLWVTGRKNWQMNACPRQLSAICVTSQQHRRV
ncbi:hypothetical protein BKD09_39280 [Bradyrhizobium japonicum]|uniref:Uncharacterized protein n=2 Tax=Nitrobacteraceae TaxID=41294 RepID=A0A1L3FM79_BRAJP|nr:hypothetical protein BKD09_39280 [Bradyrhizobium japonicum]